MVFLAGMYKEVLETALFESGRRGEDRVIIDAAETGGVGVHMGLGWGGRNITEVTVGRDEVLGPV